MPSDECQWTLLLASEFSIGSDNGLVSDIIWASVDPDLCHHIDGLVQERCNCIPNALELTSSLH